jgi:transcriptional regulator with XRE-family HTH domain
MRDKLKKITSEEDTNWIEESEQDLRQARVQQKSWKVALRVLILLKEKGISQTALAERMGVSRQQVTKIVKGKENLSLETIDKLEQALGETLLDVPSMIKQTAVPVQYHAPSASDILSINLAQVGVSFTRLLKLNPFLGTYPVAAHHISHLTFPTLSVRLDLLRENINELVSQKHKVELIMYEKNNPKVVTTVGQVGHINKKGIEEDLCYS